MSESRVVANRFDSATDVSRPRLISLLICLPLFGCSDQLSSDQLSIELKSMGFDETSVPKVGSDIWHAANQDVPSFVFKSDGQLMIQKSTSEKESRGDVVFDDGSVRYIGADHGEWGGGLFLDDWSDTQEPLLEGNVRDLVPVGKDLYIIGGLAHLGIREGSIHVMRNFSEPKAPERVLLLPDAPAVVLVDRNFGETPQITIVGHQSLMEFMPEDRLRVTESDTFWASLYPNSIVKHRDHYIIGIRSGIAVVSTGSSGRRIRYFTAK